MATIDTSIYQSLLRPPKSVMEYDAEAMGNQQNRLALQLQQGQLAAQQAGVARTNRLATVLGGFKPGLSAAEQGDALTRSGFIEEGRKVVESGAKANKDMREGEKAQREAEKFQFEQARDQIGFVNQIIGSARDQASYSQGRQAMAARGLDVSQIPEQYDPAYVQSAGAQTLTQLQRLDQVWKQKGFDLDTQKFGETVRSNKAGEGLTARGQNITIRGQNMTDARSRESNENARGVIIQTDTGPMLANSRTGTTKPIIGPDGKPVTRTKPLTEFQGKSAAFGDRAIASDKILNSIGDQYSPAGLNTKNALGDLPLVGGVAGAVANQFLSDNSQRVDQAKRDFINATLRQESGAAIGASEFANAEKQYFPQPGDSKAVKQQKAENRKLVIAGFKRSAGANAEFAPDTGNDVFSAADAILKGGK